MATPLSADRLVAALRAEGVRIKEHRSWRTHDRNHKGAWGPVNGVMIHHTVSSGDDSSVELCYNGHSTLPGPLCHAAGRNDGVVALVSAGRANHAGSGDYDVLRAVIDEVALPSANEANTDGNRHFYGLEIVNLGNNVDTYTRAQYQSAVLWAAALCRAHGWSAASVIGHKEWQPGKIDPRGPLEGGGSFSMTQFRADVKAQLGRRPGAPTTPAPPVRDEDDMNADQDARLKRIEAALDIAPWTYRNKSDDDAAKKKGTRSPDAYAYLRETHDTVKRLATSGLTADQIETAARAGADAALKALADRLTP